MYIICQFENHLKLFYYYSMIEPTSKKYAHSIPIKLHFSCHDFIKDSVKHKKTAHMIIAIPYQSAKIMISPQHATISIVAFVKSLNMTFFQVFINVKSLSTQMKGSTCVTSKMTTVIWKLKNKWMDLMLCLTYNY
jgi:hypothetical protein